MDEINQPKRSAGKIVGGVPSTQDNDEELATRRRMVVELRARNMTWVQIGEAMNITRGAAQSLYEAVCRDINKGTRELVEQVRLQTSEALDLLARRLWVETGVLAQTQTPGMLNLEAVDRLLAVLKQKGKLYGIDAPLKTEIDVRVVAELVAPMIELVVPFVPEDKIPDLYAAVEQVIGTAQARASSLQARLPAARSGETREAERK